MNHRLRTHRGGLGPERKLSHQRRSLLISRTSRPRAEFVEQRVLVGERPLLSYPVRGVGTEALLGRTPPAVGRRKCGVERFSTKPQKEDRRTPLLHFAAHRYVSQRFVGCG
jgi:hypothetical protein